MKAVTLKPDIFTNPDIAQLETKLQGSTLIFIQILMSSDKNGKFIVNENHQENIIEGLEDAKLIVTYEANGKRIGNVRKKSLFVKDSKELAETPNLISPTPDEADANITGLSGNGLNILQDCAGLVTFQQWWELYNKKVGKETTLSYWNRLKPADQILAFEHTKKYVIAQPDKQFRKDPCKYLNKRAFKDEIIISHEKPNSNRERNNQELRTLADRSQEFLQCLNGTEL